MLKFLILTLLGVCVYYQFRVEYIIGLFSFEGLLVKILIYALVSICAFYYNKTKKFVESNCKIKYYILTVVFALVFNQGLAELLWIDDFMPIHWMMIILIMFHYDHLICCSIAKLETKLEFTKAWIKTIICTLFYCLLLYNFQEGIICSTSNAYGFISSPFHLVTISFFLGSWLWVYGKQVVKTLGFSCQGFCSVFCLITPLILILIVEIPYNHLISELDFSILALNFVIYLLISFIIITFFRNYSYGFYLLYSAALVVGIANHYIIKFRRNPIMPVDIKAFNTALAVSGQYTYVLTDKIVIVMLITLISYGIISAFNQKELVSKKNYAWGKKIVAILALCFGIVWISVIDFKTCYNLKIDLWSPAKTYWDNGMAASFVSFSQMMKISKPEEYSKEDVEKLLTEEMELLDEKKQEELPSVVVIMNESFSNLDDLGLFNNADKSLKYYNTLYEETGIKEIGDNYVSVRGGGTSVTEFEFLTGFSSANLAGSNPYAQFDFSNIPSVVNVLNKQGYHTIAMHPEDPNNWMRKDVYSAMGFNEFLSKEDFEGYEKTVYNRTSDLGNYQKLIDVFNETDGSAFIFNVTMQNHGGYDINVIDENKRVQLDDQYNMYSDVVAYESLIKQSDEALQYLIEYFEKVDRPVIVCFFGDHQPSLDADFEEKLLESERGNGDTELVLQQKKYVVPYFIWSNYENELDFGMENLEGRNIMSTNYLGAQVLRYAGVQIPPFYQCLLDQKDTIPVLNFLGYYSNANEWFGLADKTEYSSLLEQYNAIQYNGMFDNNKNISLYIGGN